MTFEEFILKFESHVPRFMDVKNMLRDSFSCGKLSEIIGIDDPSKIFVEIQDDDANIQCLHIVLYSDSSMFQNDQVFRIIYRGHSDIVSIFRKWMEDPINGLERKPFAMINDFLVDSMFSNFTFF